MRKELGDGASEALVKSKVFEGNRPSNSIMFPLLTPGVLGGFVPDGIIRVTEFDFDFFFLGRCFDCVV